MIVPVYSDDPGLDEYNKMELLKKADLDIIWGGNS
jgi:hypothetical protein